MSDHEDGMKPTGSGLEGNPSLARITALLNGLADTLSSSSTITPPPVEGRRVVRTKDLPPEEWLAAVATMTPEAWAEVTRMRAADEAPMEAGETRNRTPAERPRHRRGRPSRPPRDQQKNIKMTAGVFDAFEELAEIADADLADIFEEAVLALAEAWGESEIAEQVRRNLGGRGRAPR